MGRDDRPRQGLRHRPLLRGLHQPARRLPRDHRPLVDGPGDRAAVRLGLPGRSRSPTWCAPSGPSSTCSASTGSPRWPAARSAGCRPSSGPCSTPTRSTRSWPSPARTPCTRRAWPGTRSPASAIKARPGLAGRPLLRHRPGARRRHGRGPDGRPRHVPVRRGAGRQVRPAAAVRRRHPLHDHRAGVRGRELPAPPGRLVRQAVRRQHLPLHLARADVLRPRPRARRRLAGGGARRRLGADPADRVQLRLALPARGVAGDRDRAACPGQAGRAARDRRAVRPRLLPARGGPADPAGARASWPRAGCHRDRPSRGRRPRLRLRDPAAARRPAARPQHRRPRGADLPDDQLRVRGPGVGGGVLQPAGVRQHLLAHHEPDDRGVRGTGGQPRGRRRRRRVRQRASPPRRPPCSRCSSPATTSSPPPRCTAARSTSSSTCCAR